MPNPAGTGLVADAPGERWFAANKLRERNVDGLDGLDVLDYELLPLQLVFALRSRFRHISGVAEEVARHNCRRFEASGQQLATDSLRLLAHFQFDSEEELLLAHVQGEAPSTQVNGSLRHFPRTRGGEASERDREILRWGKVGAVTERKFDTVGHMDTGKTNDAPIILYRYIPTRTTQIYSGWCVGDAARLVSRGAVVGVGVDGDSQALAVRFVTTGDTLQVESERACLAGDK